MTPKEKAKDLLDQYVDLSGIFIGDYEPEKEMCLILVNEILIILNRWDSFNFPKSSELIYWEEVKQEIEKL
jgi:hypothetical protein